MAEASSSEVGALQSMFRAEVAEGARSLEGREYLHLLDGGLSDNLGLANGIAALSVVDEPTKALREFGHDDVELILVGTVNAETETEHSWDRLDKPLSPLQVVSGLSGAQIETKNRMTVKLAQEAFSELARDLSNPDEPVHFQHVTIDFEQHPDPEERRYLRRIKTSFNLSDRKIDRLIAAARKLVRESPELARALARLEAPREAR